MLSSQKYPKVLEALSALGIDAVEEYKFHPVRKWRFDFAVVEHRLAIEIDGGIFTGGRHTRGTGFVKDMEKFNEAAVLGWRVLRFQPKEARLGVDIANFVYRAIFTQ